MKNVLIVKGTPTFLEDDDLRLALEKHDVSCTVCWWNKITVPQGSYDLAVLFGLDEKEKGRADLFASTVRSAIGPDAKFLIISRWSRQLFAEQRMKEKYAAEYFSRHDPIFHLVDTVRKMLNDEAKTAPV